MPGRLKDANDSKFQASSYVANQKENEVDLVAKYGVDDVVAEDSITEKMLIRLSTTLALVVKEVEQNTHNNRLLIKQKSKNEK